MTAAPAATLYGRVRGLPALSRVSCVPHSTLVTCSSAVITVLVFLRSSTVVQVVYVRPVHKVARCLLSFLNLSFSMRLEISGPHSVALKLFFYVRVCLMGPVSYTHLTLPTNREV